MKKIGLDVGDKRIGIAISDMLCMIASARESYVRKDEDTDLKYFAELAKAEGADAFVLGLPKNMDGTEGERARKSRKLAKTVEIWSGLPVRMWDERQTTCAAADLLDESGTYGSRRKEILDSVSATVILEDYLAWRKEHPGEI